LEEVTVERVQEMPVLWRAGRDRIAHARRRRPDLRALCGERVVDEREAWPQLRRCTACLKLVADAAGTLL
jgi:hypothetical protein